MLAEREGVCVRRHVVGGSPVEKCFRNCVARRFWNMNEQCVSFEECIEINSGANCAAGPEFF